MLGWELKALRKQAGLKSGEIATILGVNPSTWSRYERGHLVVPVAIEYATLYLMQLRNRPSAQDRLVEALKEVVCEGTSERPVEASGGHLVLHLPVREPQVPDPTA